MNLEKFNFKPSEISSFMRTAMIDVGEGIELCVEVGGNPNNPPILLIMGLGSQLIFWPDNFVKLLIDGGFFVVRFDNRDIGLSTKIQMSSFPQLPKINQLKMMMRVQVGLPTHHLPVAYNLFDMAEDSKRLIDTLGLQNVYLIGASMGGMISQILASRYPDKIKKLGLLFTSNNQPFLPPPKFKQLNSLFSRPKSDSLEDVLAYSLWFAEQIGSPNHLDLSEVKELAKLRYERCYYPQGVLRQLHAILATGSLRSYNLQTTQPTIVLHGDKDGLVPVSHGRAVAKAIPNSHFHLIEGMGHDLVPAFLPILSQKFIQHYFDN